MAEADVEALERGYAALNGGDLSVVLELLDPDIEWHEPGPSPEAGTHRGRDSFERFFRSWLESVEGFRVEPERVFQVEARLAHVWTVADGKAIRWEADADLEAVLGDGG